MGLEVPAFAILYYTARSLVLSSDSDMSETMAILTSRYRSSLEIWTSYGRAVIDKQGIESKWLNYNQSWVCCLRT